jgi:hypothetical protein
VAAAQTAAAPAAQSIYSASAGASIYDAVEQIPASSSGGVGSEIMQPMSSQAAHDAMAVGVQAAAAAAADAGDAADDGGDIDPWADGADGADDAGEPGAAQPTSGGGAVDNNGGGGARCPQPGGLAVAAGGAVTAAAQPAASVERGLDGSLEPELPVWQKQPGVQSTVPIGAAADSVAAAAAMAEAMGGASSVAPAAAARTGPKKKRREQSLSASAPSSYSASATQNLVCGGMTALCARGRAGLRWAQNWSGSA